MATKNYDSFKRCRIRTSTSVFEQSFTNDWSYSDIKDWMIGTFCIEEDSILDLTFSSVTFYKLSKNA